MPDPLWLADQILTRVSSEKNQHTRCGIICFLIYKKIAAQIWRCDVENDASKVDSFLKQESLYHTEQNNKYEVAEFG